jgi:hypothetical protein
VTGIDDWARTEAAEYGQGANRWQAWCAAGRPIVDRSDLAIIGDPAIVYALDEHVWPLLPDAIRHHLVQTTMIFASGVQTLGWCRDMPALPARSMFVVVLTTRSPSTIAHELSHSWHRFPVYTGCTVAGAAAGIVAANEILKDRPAPPRHEDPSELMADRLATEILGYRVDTCSWTRRDP